ncbi:MarR family winged helix-turn-helix transcriptional regulator [Deinococcus arenicola]|uniref:MarR family winged helix-turn-helix transcriptional regulator n=1 Tax=Deinococcus arenicola TaxID=2994950 RepID=A0ABU4DP22_9DEIO|nr:MarR family winged helix-turn-helix transcriptional regulator [Deinococcus sp. ZS9-10]MDV6374181.1 MarR family winged helix-turn-helix transcriptional regulator [Deinococcus sp. ZS9-10]
MSVLPPLPDDELNSPELHFLTALWDTWQALTTVGEARLRAGHGLDLRGFVALSYLQAGPQQPAELARELGVPRYEVSRVLAALDALGAITRERMTRESEDTDARGVIVRITPAGRERWAAALHTIRALTGPPLAHLDTAQQLSLIHTLQTVAHAAQQQQPGTSRPPQKSPNRSRPHD